MYQVYTISGAPRPWRVLLGLTFKELDYEIVYLQGSRREHKATAFLKLNPRGTVPVLKGEGITMCDSIAILAWLDRRHPDKPLFGRNLKDSAEIWQQTMDGADYLRAACHSLLQPILGGAVGRTEAPSEAEMRQLKAPAQRMDAELRRLEAMLDARPFLVGDTPTAADAVAYPEVRLVQRAAETRTTTMTKLGFGVPSANYPKVADWKKRIEALPGFHKTMPPHWREAA